MMRSILFWALLVLQISACSGKTHDPYDAPPEHPDEPVQHTVGSAADLKAQGSLAAGDVVVWRDGTYSDVIAELKGAGTAEKPVVLRAETPGGVCFTATSRLSIAGSHVRVEGFWWKDPQPVRGKAVVTFAKGSSHCVLTDCAITGDNTAEEGSIDTKWVSLYGTQNSVEKCTLRDKRNMGTQLVVWLETGIVPWHTIRTNYFSRPVTLYGTDNKAANGQETIRIGTSDFSMQQAACTVEDNYFYRCHGEQAEIISNKSCDNSYRNNLFVESKGTLTMRHGNNCTVSNNYFVGNNLDGTGGIRLIGADHTVENNYLHSLAGTGYRTAICLVRAQENPALSGYWQVRGATVRGNTILDCRYAFNVNYASSNSDQMVPVIETLIEQNTVSLSSTSQYAVDCVTSPAPDITWRDNIIYGGRQRGVSLPVGSAPPALPNVQAAMDAIRAQAGCNWTTE